MHIYLHTASLFMQVRKYPSRKWATVIYDKHMEDTTNTNPMTK